MRVKKISDETSYVFDAVAPAMSSIDVNFLKNEYKKSKRRRHRLCFHQNPGVDLHDIIICYDKSSYIPPNKHIGKVESLLMLSGTIDFYLFNDSGMVYDRRRLSSNSKDLPFYVRVPANTWHGLRAVGDEPCIIKETISGPYDTESLAWAPFAPSESEGSSKGFTWYDNIEKECIEKNIGYPDEETFLKVSENIFKSARQLTTLSISQIIPIIEAAFKSKINRSRLCCHISESDRLQEMFIVLTKEVNIEESIHIRKDESVTVISGKGKYLFPNEDGSIRSEITLREMTPVVTNDAEESYFFARINRYVPHKIEVISDYIIIHEATSGPFLRSDTDYRISQV